MDFPSLPSNRRSTCLHRTHVLHTQAIPRGRWSHRRNIIINLYSSGIPNPAFTHLSFYSAFVLKHLSDLTLNLWSQTSWPSLLPGNPAVFPYATHFLTLSDSYSLFFPQASNVPSLLIPNQELCLLFQWENRWKQKRIPYPPIIKFTNFLYVPSVLILSSNPSPCMQNLTPSCLLLFMKELQGETPEKNMQNLLCISIF